MIKRLIVVICFLLGVLVIISWLMRANTEIDGKYSRKENYISLLLLAMLWGTPLLLFKHSGNDNNDPV